MIISHNLATNTYVASGAQSYTGGSIKGRVTAAGVIYPCTVSVHERMSRRLIESKRTDMQGNYRFDNLTTDFQFFVMVTDPKCQFNAVIQDNVVPK